jgi:hypothetical protein
MSTLSARTTDEAHPLIGWRSRAWDVVRIVLGLLLLAAAGLKVYGWSVSTVPPVGWFSTPRVQAAAIGWEIFLGAWLLSGILPIGSWLAAIGTFTLLAAISGYLGWIGQATCGCFGTIEASPWHVLAVDVAAVVLLIAGLRNLRTTKSAEHGTYGRTASAVGYFVLSVGLILASFAGIGAWVYGSPEVALAQLRGESVTVASGYVDFGVGQPGEVLEAQVEVRNLTKKPVKIIGGTSNCSCMTTQDLPVTLASGETRTIPVRLRVQQSEPGVFTRIMEFWTDSGDQRTIRFRASYRLE